MIDKIIEQQETIKGMQENEESAIKIMKMYEDYKLRVDRAINFINEFNRIILSRKDLSKNELELMIVPIELLEILKGVDKQ